MNRIDCRKHDRRGTTLIEVGIATFLMTVLATTLAQGLLTMHAQRAETRRRQVARFETANELQRVAALGWTDIVKEPSGPVALSETAKQELPSGRLTARIETLPDDPTARRIHVELEWIGPLTGQPEEPIRLTAWVHQKARRESP